MASNDALEKLKDAMKDGGKSVEELFREIDTDGDGRILQRRQKISGRGADSGPGFNDYHRLRYQWR